MKKILILSFLSISIISLSKCKSEEKKAETEKTIKVEVKSTAKFSLKNAKNTIGWTAYKTTEKIPVKGEFKKVSITANGDGNTIREAVNNTEFSIPVSSIFTKDTSRDYKIRKFFFSFMDTKLLEGKLEIVTDTTGIASITMNSISNKVPFSYTIKDNSFNMKSIIDINKWNAMAALESLNKVCKELHKGADGVSKTWNEVTININSDF